MALYNNPGGATLAGTLTMTAHSGVATFSGLTLNKAAGGYTLLVSGSGETGATTSAFSVTAAAATQLVVTSRAAQHGVAAGSAFGLVVSAEDPFGNVDPNFRRQRDHRPVERPRRLHARRHADRDGPGRRQPPSPA